MVSADPSPDVDDPATRHALRRRVTGSVSTHEALPHRYPVRAVRPVQSPDHHLRPLLEIVPKPNCWASPLPKTQDVVITSEAQPYADRPGL